MALVVWLLCLAACVSAIAPEPFVAIAEKEPAFNSRSFRNALNQQGLQTILLSIEERLRTLDQVYSMRYQSSQNADQLARKIDSLESKITRLETMFDVQVTKLSEYISTKNFKDDILKDQLFRKMDSIYERINHKIGFVEAKVEMDFLKMQSKIESSVNKMDRLDHSISVRQADMETTISDGINKIENIKSDIANTENKIINATKQSFEKLYQNQVQNMEIQITNMTKNLDDFQNNINETYSHIFDQQKNNNEETRAFMKRFKEFDEKINNQGNKMSNMYNELWKKMEVLHITIDNVGQSTNSTRREILKKLETSKSTMNDNANNEVVIESLLKKKFSEISRNMESNFESVQLSQRLFLDSCHRIQSDESQLENKISLVLERMLDSFMNKSASTLQELRNIEDLIKEHDSNVYSSAKTLSNTIVKLADKTSDDRKKIEKTLSNVREDLSKSLVTIKQITTADENGYAVRLQNIIDLLQKIEQNDLETNAQEKEAMKNMTEKIISEIASKLDTQKLKQINETLVDNSVMISSIESITKNILELLQSIEKQLNKTDKSELVLVLDDDTENSKLERYNYTVLENSTDSDGNATRNWLNLFNLLSNRSQIEESLEKTDSVEQIENEHQIIGKILDDISIKLNDTDDTTTTTETTIPTTQPIKPKHHPVDIDMTDYFGAQHSRIMYHNSEELPEDPAPKKEPVVYDLTDYFGAKHSRILFTDEEGLLKGTSEELESPTSAEHDVEMNDEHSEENEHEEEGKTEK